MDDDGRRWETVQAAAYLMSVSERTIHRMAKDRRLLSKHEGARLFVDITDHVPAEPEPESDLVSLSAEVDRLRAAVDKLSFQVEQVTGERDRLWTQVQFQNSQIATLMRLSEHEAIEQPKTRRWRWPWQGDD